MITVKEMKDLELQVPKYEFVEPEEGAQEVSPVKRQIAKIQETASTFTLYDVYRSMGMLEKRIKDREAENEADRKMLKLFKAELTLIEKALGVSKMEKQFQNELAAEAAVAQAAKETVAEQAAEPAEAVPSPYADGGGDQTEHEKDS